jgi:hypothetical protein
MRTMHHIWLFVGALAAVGCGSSSSGRGGSPLTTGGGAGEPGTGGSVQTGGDTGTGGLAGAPATTGGTAGTGGSVTDAGTAGIGGVAPPSGGSAGVAGSQPTGGAPATGGSPGTGGAVCTAVAAVTAPVSTFELADWSYVRPPTNQWVARCAATPCLSCNVQWSPPTWTSATHVAFMSGAGSSCTGDSTAGWNTGGALPACSLDYTAASSGDVVVDFDVLACTGGFCAVGINVTTFTLDTPACFASDGADSLHAAASDVFVTALRATVWTCG